VTTGRSRRRRQRAETSVCLECGAKCCRYAAVEIDAPTCKRDYDNIRWFLLHRNVFVYRSHDGSWHLEFATPCEWLTAEHKCRHYERRPRICRDHGTESEECVAISPHPPHDLLFTSVDEFESYLDSRGKDWKWKR
jgi:hypothetical protein